MARRPTSELSPEQMYMPLSRPTQQQALSPCRSVVPGSRHQFGGGSGTEGTTYRMTADGVVQTVFSFDGTDGDNPIALTQDTNGSIYGVTTGGGDLSCYPNYGCGTVFAISMGLRSFASLTPNSGKVCKLRGLSSDSRKSGRASAGVCSGRICRSTSVLRQTDGTALC